MKAFRISWLFLLGLSVTAAAAEPWQRWVSYERFESLALELAPRVDLFRAIWNVDPDAELYGGTSRDFLWLLRRRLAAATTEAEVEAAIASLRSGPIEVPHFLAPPSDVDVIGNPRIADAVPFDERCVTKIEVHSPKTFEPGTKDFERERDQGGVAVEKIRLAKGRFVDAVDPSLRNGVREIYDGRPTIVVKDSIRQTDMFQRHENHPLLVALRWVRQVAVAYFQRHGKGYPEEAKLETLVDAESARQAQRVLVEVRRHPEHLQPFLENALFVKRLNRLLEKIFRSHTNPTAAKRLFERLAIDETLAPFMPKPVNPFHTLAYALRRDPARLRVIDADPAVGRAVRPLGEYARREGLSREPASDGTETVPLLHGTPDPAFYRGIVFLGAARSEGGSAGAGVYAADSRSRAFAENWRAEERPTGVPPLVVKLRIRADARFLDLTAAPGKALLSNSAPSFIEALAERVQADVVRFPYDNGVHAYVIRNGSVIVEALPDSLPLLTFSEAKAALAGRVGDLDAVAEIVSADPSLGPRLPELLLDWPRDLLATAVEKAFEWVPKTMRKYLAQLDRGLRARFDADVVRELHRSWYGLYRDAFRTIAVPPVPSSLLLATYNGLGAYDGHLGETADWTRKLRDLPDIDVLEIVAPLWASWKDPIVWGTGNPLAVLSADFAKWIDSARASGPGTSDFERLRAFLPLYLIASGGRESPVDAAALLSQLIAYERMAIDRKAGERDNHSEWMRRLYGKNLQPEHDWTAEALDVCVRHPSACGGLSDAFDQWYRRGGRFAWDSLAAKLLQGLAKVPEWNDVHRRWAERVLLRWAPNLRPGLSTEPPPRPKPERGGSWAAELQMPVALVPPTFLEEAMVPLAHALERELRRGLGRDRSLAERNALARTVLALFPGYVGLARAARTLFPEGLDVETANALADLATAREPGVIYVGRDQGTDFEPLARIESVAAFLRNDPAALRRLRENCESEKAAERFSRLGAFLRGAGVEAAPDGWAELRDGTTDAMEPLPDPAARRVGALMGLPAEAAAPGEWAELCRRYPRDIGSTFLRWPHVPAAAMWIRLFADLGPEMEPLAGMRTPDRPLAFQIARRMQKAIDREGIAGTLRTAIEAFARSVPWHREYHPMNQAAKIVAAGRVPVEDPEDPSLRAIERSVRCTHLLIGVNPTEVSGESGDGR